MPCRVSVKSSQGEDATIVVTVVQGRVWISIVPPFTWEAIIEPEKVDDVIHVLGLAREEAKRMGFARGRWASRGDRIGFREITRGASPS